MGRLAGRPRPDELRLIGWAIEADDLDATARRLGVSLIQQVMIFERGGTWSWRAVADSRSFASLPFFVGYDVPAERRLARWNDLYLRADHESPPGAVRWVEQPMDVLRHPRTGSPLVLPRRASPDQGLSKPASLNTARPLSDST